MSRRPLAMVSTRSEEPDDVDQLALTDDGQEQSQAQRGRDTDSVVAALTGADLSTPLTMDRVPAPYAPSEAAELDAQERRDLTTCEQAVAGLQTSFALAGKALATLNQARLYRETHATFVDYLEDRWQMSESQAYRLMDGWQVAGLLDSHGITVFNERQSRELILVFRQHGGPAMVDLAKSVTKHVPKPTAAVYGAARKALPRQLPDDPDQRERLVDRAAKEALPRTASPNGGEPPAPPTGGGGDSSTGGGDSSPTASPNGGETATGADPGDMVNQRLHEGVEHLERAWASIHEATSLGATANNLGAAMTDSSKGTAIAQRIIKALNPGVRTGGEA